MSRPASTTSAHSDTSGATSSPSAARDAARPQSSGAPGAPAAASGTGTGSTTAARSSRPPPPSADAARLREGFAADFAHLARLLRGERPDLSAAAIRRWPAYAGEECLRCGAFTGCNLPRNPPSSCPSCQAPPPFHFARSLFVYEGRVREGIRAAKYGRQPLASEALAERLFEAIRGKWSDRFPDVFRPAVVPVPVPPVKYFRRGFNLPALVGRALAGRAGWPYSPLLLRRAGGDTPQAGLRLDAREENVRDAFQAAPGARAPSDVLLLDDVYTSGATAAACARALKTAGAQHIVVVTAARAVL